jgi:smad nuclear-interacting protein 1
MQDHVRSKNDQFRTEDIDEKKVPLEGPNFEVSGLLAETQNQRNGVPLVFSLASDSSRPREDDDWRLFEFRSDGSELSRRFNMFPCYLFGSEKGLSSQKTDDDISFVLIDHPSCAPQHAVIQFRRRSDGRVLPYLLDLDSVTGTALNGSRVEPSRYIEIRSRDLIQFGQFSCEFILMNGNS